ncbi:S-adenosyl-L-methionine-dependent methyltransferase [Pilobolus umbonatus]|nr:S-adenosyl-L-methionine-dependent methyltransferase [Pilobolus umbonatus]
MFFASLITYLKKKSKRATLQFPIKAHSKPRTIKNDSNITMDSSIPASNSSDGKNFHHIDGRRYHNDEDVGYILPNDETAISQKKPSNFHAPVHDLLEKGIVVVDSGCGPATWTFEMAEDYPNSQFTGIDISFVFPETIRPPNANFRICNISKEMPFDDNSVDYYHQRLLVAGLSKGEMELALLNAYRVLKPGGYIELCEVNMGYCENAGPYMERSQEEFAVFLEKRSLVPNLGDHIEEMLEESGFENIHYTKKTIPVNHTNKAGDFWWQDSSECMRSLRPVLAMNNPLYEDIDYYEEYIKTIGQECNENKTNIIFGIAYAQKPLSEYY